MHIDSSKTILCSKTNGRLTINKIDERRRNKTYIKRDTRVEVRE